MIFRPCKVLAQLKQRLAGDAADVQAGAAKGGAFFDKSDLETQLRGAEGAHVTAGSGAEDGNVK
jgi:hypothetical protein